MISDDSEIKISSSRFFLPIISLLEKLIYRSSHQEEFLEKDVPKICSKFIRERPCRSAISIKLFCKFIEITLRHGCAPLNLLHIYRTAFPKNTF